MDISAQMLIFATVVEQGSISAAARSMGQTPSAVSKQISLLEDQVHCRLLDRTRTGVSPTQEGQDFYEKCKAMADKFKEAGLNPPKTFADIQAAIGKLHNPPEMYGFVAATKIDETYMMQLIEHISLANGYSPINADGSINEDTSKLKEVLQFYKAIADATIDESRLVSILLSDDAPPADQPVAVAPVADELLDSVCCKRRYHSVFRGHFLFYLS